MSTKCQQPQKRIPVNVCNGLLEVGRESSFCRYFDHERQRRRTARLVC